MDVEETAAVDSMATSTPLHDPPKGLPEEDSNMMQAKTISEDVPESSVPQLGKDTDARQQRIKLSLISLGLIVVLSSILGVSLSSRGKRKSSLAVTSCSACPAGTDMTQWNEVFSNTAVDVANATSVNVTNNVTDGNTTQENSWLQAVLVSMANNNTVVNETEYPSFLLDLSCAEVDILATNYTSDDPECTTIQQYVPDLCQCRVPTPAPTNRPSVSSSPTGLPTSQPSMMPVPTNPPTQHPVGPPVRNFDRFTYEETIVNDEQTDYGPEEWYRVQCPDKLSCVSDKDSQKEN